MKKLLKISALLATLFLIALVIVAVIFTFTFDPNAYKKEITAEVKKATGRTLRIKGKIQLSYFPWLGVNLSKISLSNARGFGSQPFAKIKSAGVAVKVLPLISGNIVVKRLRLNGLILNPRIRKDGRNNWDDLAGKDKKDTKKQDSEVPSFTIGGVQIKDANINYLDEQAGQRYTLKKLNLSTGSVTLGEPIDLKLDFQFKDKKNTLPVSLDTTLLLDTKKQTARLDNFSLAVNDFKLSGNIQASQIFDKPSANGTVSSNTFDLGALLKLLGNPIVTADKKALSNTNFKTNFAFAGNVVRLDTLSMNLDDTKINGKASVNLDSGAIRFNLKLDNIDADRYLAPSSAAGSGSETILTVQDIRALNGISGQLNIGSLKAFGIKSQKVETSIHAANNKLTIGPSKARLYGGSYQGKIVVDANGKTPRITLNEKVRSIKLEPFLRDAAGTSQISGVGSVTLNANTQGKSSNALTRNLNGRLNVFSRNGKVKGLDLKKIATSLVALGDKLRLRKPRIKRERGDETAFDKLTMSAIIKNGVAHTNDISIKGPNLDVTGKGTVDALSLAQDLEISATLIEASTGKQASVPLLIRGTVSEPKVRLNFSKLTEKKRAKVKARHKKKIDKKKKKLKAKWKKLLGK